MTERTVLKDIGSCKQKLLASFVNSDEICELLFNKKPYTEDDVGNLLYNQIFPYLYVDDAQDKTLAYLCFEVDVPRTSSGTVKDMKLIVWAYCHKDIMEYSKKGYYGTRVDILSDMVERKLRDSYDFGIGKIELTSLTNFFPNDKYYGKQMIYNVPDFMVKG